MKKINLDSLWGLLIIVSIVILGVTFYRENFDNVKIDNEVVENISGNWTVVSKEGKENVTILPKVKAIQAGEKVILEKNISYQCSETCLMFYTANQKVKVFLEGREIYSFGHRQDKMFGKTPGSSWNFVSLPQGGSGDTIQIHLTEVYDDGMVSIPTLWMGTKSACVFYLFRHNFIKGALSAFLLLCGILLIVVYFIVNKVIYKRKHIFYLGLFSVLVGISTLIESKLLQLFFGNQGLLTNGIFFTNMIAPIPLILYLRETYFNNWRKQYSWIAKIFALNYIILVLLQLVNLYDLMETSRITLGLMMATVGYMVYTLIQLWKTEKRNKGVIIYALGLFLLLVSVALDIVRYAFCVGTDTATFHRLGLLAFVALLSSLEFYRIIILVKKGLKSRFFERLAYEDVLTKCKNRFYFEKKFAQVNEGLKEDQKVAVAIFDMNDLKQINDFKGHSQGDNMLVVASQMIVKYFEEYGEISRIGGDEFAVIIEDGEEAKLEEAFLKFHKDMEEKKKQYENFYRIAYGYAFYSSQDKDLSDTFNRADQDMYRRKKVMKEQTVVN